MELPWTRHVHTLLFDLDGTLIDSSEAIVESVNQALKQMGKPQLTPEFIRSRIGYRLEDAVGEWTESEKVELMRLNRATYQTVCLEKTVLMNGVFETIEHLKQRGFRMAVATGKQREVSREILRHLQLLPFFDAVVGSDDVLRMKPDPETLLKALNHLQEQREASVYIGDTVVDIQASRRAGIRCISVLGGTDTRESIEQEGPDYIIKDFFELRELF